MLLTGMELGHFRLKDLIGRSANDVYLADDLHLQGREVAIKVMQTDITSFPTSGKLNDAVAQFEREALIVSKLHHPHILQLFEYGQETQNATVYTYLVMPYKKDGTLERWVKHRTASFRNLLPLHDIGNIISTAADALQYAHDAGVIHRDVKFSNFLIDDRTSHLDYPRILLADFGIAKIGEVNQTTRAIGTFDYMAPEQWDGHPTKASDQYSLAVIAYKLLTGHMPFKGNPLELYRQHHDVTPLAPSQCNPILPPAIDNVLFRALAKQPADRYPSIKQFAEELRAAILQPVPSLEVPLDITEEEAYRGTIKTVKLPDGSELAVTIPPHVQNGQTISIPGRGKLHHDGSRGPLIVKLMVAVGLDNTNTILAPPKVSLSPQIPPRPRPPFKKLLLAGLALFLIISAVPLYFTWTTYKQGIASMNATATANAPILATKTAHAHATATASAHATATVGVLVTATSGQTLYTDPLNNPKDDNTKNAGWAGLGGSSSFCLFRLDGYHIDVTSSSARPQPCLENNLSYQDATITVNMAIVSSSSSAGLVFRSQSSGTGSGYFFEVSPNQQNYKISLLNCTCNALWGWVHSPVIHSGNATNTLQVITRGSDFKFYINNTFLTEITDSHYTSGGIGFACYDSGDNGEVVFSNLKVYSLS